MLSFTHTLTSLPLAYLMSSPLLIFAAAFVWHLLCDSLLHWNVYAEDYKRYPWFLVMSDVAGGLLFAWLATGDDILTLPVLAAIAGGNAPDVAHTVWDALPRAIRSKFSAWATPWFQFHNNLQLEAKSWHHGWQWQAFLITVAIALVTILR